MASPAFTNRAQRANLFEDGSVLSAGGAFLFTDADVGERHTAFFVNAQGAQVQSLSTSFGTVNLGALTDTVNGRGGSVSWTYSADNASLQQLARGQVVTETFTINLRDAAGNVVQQTLTVTLTGANDAVVITAATDSAGLVIEGDAEAGRRTDSGVIKFTDADDRDTHAATVSGVGRYGSFRLGAVVENVNATEGVAADGSVPWTYTANPASLNFLAAGQEVTDTFTVRVTDRQGSTVSQVVTVTLRGTNDDVVITSAVQRGNVSELSQGESSASGAVLFTDVDVRDRHTGSLSADEPVSEQEGQYGTLALGALTDTVNGRGGSQAWTYTADQDAINFLARGETRTDTFTIYVADGQGSVKSQAVTITVTGQNDEVVLEAVDVAETLTEDADISSATGTIDYSDADLRDAHAVSFRGVARYGSFSTAIAKDTESDANEGTVTWNYQIDPVRIQALGENQMAQEVFTVLVTDRNGSTAEQQVVVTLVGTNDNVIVTSQNRSVALTEGNVDGDVVAAGVMTFVDADVLDRHQTYVSTGSTDAPADQREVQGTYGTLVLGDLVDTSNGTGGRQPWVYVVEHALADELGQGDIATDTFTLYVRDASGTVSSQTVTITLTGTNDAPRIDVEGSLLVGEVDEPAPSDEETGGLLVATGEVLGFDVDRGDSVRYSVAERLATELQGADGEPVALTEAQAGFIRAVLFDTFSVDEVSGQWTMDISELPEGALDALAAGDRLSLTWTVVVTDEFNATATTDVTVTIVGTNDAPMILSDESDLSASLSEVQGTFDAQSGENIVTGTIAAADIDRVDSLTFYVDAEQTTVSYRAFGADDTSDVPADVDGGVDAVFSIDEETGEWTYDASGLNLDALGQGDVLTLTFTVVVEDTLGEQDRETVTITITGTNDTPVIVADGVAESVLTGAVAEADEDEDTEDTLVAEGRVVATDVDAGASYTVAADEDLEVSFAYRAADEDEFNGITELAGLELSAIAAAFSVAEDGAWTFDASELDLDALAEFDELRITFPVVVTDEHDARAFTAVSVTITGRNDAPVVRESTTTGALTEDASTGEREYEVNVNGQPVLVTETVNIAAGQVNFTDADLGDEPLASVATNGQGGVVVQAEFRKFLEQGMFEVIDVPETLSLADLRGAFDVRADGSWTYDATYLDLDALGEGDELQLTFTVVITDNTGATAEQPVVITLTGTNDAPVVTGAVSEDVTEDTGEQRVSLTGGVSDPDFTDELSVSEVTIDSDGLGDAVTLDGNDLVIDTDAESVQNLGRHSTATVTASYLVSDDSGAANSTAELQQSATVTVQGVNDAVMLTDNGVQESEVGGSGVLIDAQDVDPFMAIPESAFAAQGVFFNDAFSILNFHGTGGVNAFFFPNDSLGLIDVPQGFSGQFAFNYGAPSPDHRVTVQIWDDLNGSGHLLAEMVLDSTSSYETTASQAIIDFEGTARSVVFVGQVRFITLDELIFGSAEPVTAQDFDYTEAADASTQVLPAASGTMTVSDLDIGDTLNFTVGDDPVVMIDGEAADLPVGALALVAAGAFTLDQASATSNGGDITLGYTYAPAAANLDFLAEGQSLTITYTVTADDIELVDDEEVGTSASQDVTITITGTNDTPVISLETTPASEVSTDVLPVKLEGDGHAEGVTFTRQATAEFTAEFQSGVDGFDPSNLVGYVQLSTPEGRPQQYATFVVSLVAPSGEVIHWFSHAGPTFATIFVADPAYTGENEFAQHAFTNVRVAADFLDNLSGVEDVDGTWTLRITYDTDVPLQMGGNTGIHSLVGWGFKLGGSAVTEVPAVEDSASADVDEGNAALSVSGTLTVTDADNRDTVNVSAGEGVSTEGPLGELTEEDLLPLFSVTPANVAADAGDAHNVSWSFNAAAGLFDYLAEGDTLTLTYTVQVQDDSGAEDGTMASQDITITITGTNDVPVAEAADNAVDEDATITGSVSATDADRDETDGLTFALVDEAPEGLTFNENGTYTFDASAYDELREGEPLVLTIPFTATDVHGAVSESANLVITITGKNDAVAFVEETAVAEPIGFEGFAHNTQPGNAISGFDFRSFTVLSDSSSPVDTPFGSKSIFTPRSEQRALINVEQGFTTQLSFHYAAPNFSGYVNGLSVELWSGLNGTGELLLSVSLAGTTADRFPGGALYDDFAEFSRGFEGVAKSVVFAGAVIEGANNFYVLDEFTFGSATVSLGDTVAEAMNAQAQTLEVSGTITVTDADVGDTLVSTAAVKSVTLNGDVYELPAGAASLVAQDVFMLDPASTESNGDEVSIGYTYAPTADLDFLAEGDELVLTFTVTVSDGLTQAEQDITITITGSNDAPVVEAATNMVDEDAMVEGSVSGTDADRGETEGLTYALVGNAPEGLTFNADGTYTFDASGYDEVRDGVELPVVVSYVAIDAQGVRSAPADLTITVTGVNDAVSLAEAPVAAPAGVEVRLDFEQFSRFTQLMNTEIQGVVLNGFITFAFDGFDDNGEVFLAPDNFVVESNQFISVANVPNGFTGEFSFNYGGFNSSVNDDNLLRIYSGPNGTGTLLATQILDGVQDPNGPQAMSTDFYSVTLPFQGTAQSVVFTGGNGFYFDDFRFSNVLAPASQPQEDAPITEALDASEQAIAGVSGSFIATDLDVGDTLTTTAAVASVTLDGEEFTLPEGAESLIAQDAFTFVPESTTSNGGEVTIDYTYAPTANLDFLAEGEELVLTFTVTVSDGPSEATQGVVVTILGTNDAPVVAAALAESTSELFEAGLEQGDETTVSYDLLEGATDVDGDELSVDAGTLEVSVNGVPLVAEAYSFDAETQMFTLNRGHAAFNGLDVDESVDVVVSYFITDGTDTANHRVEQRLTITVEGVNDAPVAADDEAEVIEAGLEVAVLGTGEFSSLSTEQPMPLPVGLASTSGNLLGNDVDPEGEALSLVAVGETEVPAFEASGPMEEQGPGTAQAIVISTLFDLPPGQEQPQNGLEVLAFIGIVFPSQLQEALPSQSGNFPQGSAYKTYVNVGGGNNTLSFDYRFETAEPDLGSDSNNDGAVLVVHSVDASGARTSGLPLAVLPIASVMAQSSSGSFEYEFPFNGDFEVSIAVFDNNDDFGESRLVVSNLHGVPLNERLGTEVIGNVQEVAILRPPMQQEPAAPTNVEVDGTYGTLTVNATGAYTYTLDNELEATQALAQGTEVTDVFTYTVQDASGLTSTATLTVTVTGSNDAAAFVVDAETRIASAELVESNEALMASGQLVVADPDLGDELTLTVQGVTFTLTLDGEQLMLAPEQALELRGQLLEAISVEDDGAWSFELASPDLLPQDAVLTASYEVSAQDQHGLMSSNVDSITVTITGANDPLTANDDDNGEDAITEAGVVVEEGITLPVSGDASATGNLLANDADPDLGEQQSLTVVSVDGFELEEGSVMVEGTYGTLMVAADGTWNYTLDNEREATQALADGQAASESFTYMVADAGGSSDEATLTLNITGTNDAPVFEDISADATEDEQALVVDLLLGATDAEDDLLSVTDLVLEGFEEDDLPAGITLNAQAGTLTVDTENDVFDELAAGEPVSFTVNYRVQDALGASAARSATVVVTGVNDAPVANDDVDTNDMVKASGKVGNTVILGQAMATGEVLGNDTDVDNDAADLFVSAVNGEEANIGMSVLGTYGRLTLNSDGSYEYELDNTLAATKALANNVKVNDVFTYTVSDGDLTDVAQLSIEVTGTNDAPVVEDATVGINDDGTDDGQLTLNLAQFVSDADRPMQSLVWRLGDDQNNEGEYGTLVLGSTGQLSYTVDAEKLAMGGDLMEVIHYQVRDALATVDEGYLTIDLRTGLSG